jgi:hypothetical protein
VYAATHFVVNAIVVGIILGLPVLVLTACAGGVYLGFRSAAWTLTYRELPAWCHLERGDRLGAVWRVLMRRATPNGRRTLLYCRCASPNLTNIQGAPSDAHKPISA